MSTAAGEKLPYEKPVVQKIDLAADEVLAVGCKLDSTAVAAFGRPTCTVRPCNAKGS